MESNATGSKSRFATRERELSIDCKGTVNTKTVSARHGEKIRAIRNLDKGRPEQKKVSNKD